MKTDFFISYTSKDQQQAEWVAWILEENGYSVVIQAWDFKPGNNFVLEMQNATIAANKTIAILSNNYLKSLYTHPEWAAAFAKDPKGESSNLIPIRVKECNLKGMLSNIIYIDLVNKTDQEATEILLRGVSGQRLKPNSPPKLFTESLNSGNPTSSK